MSRVERFRGMLGKVELEGEVGEEWQKMKEKRAMRETEIEVGKDRKRG